MSGRGAGDSQRGLRILYEDDRIIALDKPCGLPTIAPEGSRARSLYDLVSAHIRRRNPKGRAALVHRLDRDTSGVIIFAKDARSKTALMSSWNESVSERGYLALVEGRPPAQEGVLDSWLAERDPYRVRQVPPGTRGALRAITRYRVMAEGAGLCLVELFLETGRRHQIRVQLAAIGCPVAGDERYGSRRNPIGRLALHASSIAIRGFSNGEVLRIPCPPPPGFARALEDASPETGRSAPASRRGTPASGQGTPASGQGARRRRRP